MNEFQTEQSSMNKERDPLRVIVAEALAECGLDSSLVPRFTNALAHAILRVARDICAAQWMELLRRLSPCLAGTALARVLAPDPKGETQSDAAKRLRVESARLSKLEGQLRRLLERGNPPATVEQKQQS